MDDVMQYLSKEQRARVERVALATRQAIVRDELRVLAARLRADNPDWSPAFTGGVDWAVLYMENVANQLNEGLEPPFADGSAGS